MADIVASNPAPVAQEERIIVLDCLRGIALCGILLMNIPGFAFPSQASFDPTIYDEKGTFNFTVYYLIEWIPEGTQRAIFSMLFGAGMLIFLGRQEQKMKGTLAAELFMRRQLWLLLFGLINAFILLWHWDILYAYAICGILVMPFRRLSTGKLLIAALIALLFISLRETKHLYEGKEIIRKGEAVALLDTTVNKWTKTQRKNWEEMNGFKEESSLASRKEKAAEQTETMLGYMQADYNEFERTKLILWDGYEISRLCRSIGLLGTLLLLYRVPFFHRIMQVFRPVGQMAFTNYLMQSILGGLIFYGIGFGYFGKLQRYEIYFVVFAIWVFQILFSHIWLRYFRFSPLEWLWRSLTYWKKQPWREVVSGK